MLYVLIKITTLTRVFCAVKLTDKVRLVGTYHGKRMYVFGFVRSGQRDKTKENRGACGRSAGYIDNAGRVVPGLPFLIGVIKLIYYVQKEIR